MPRLDVYELTVDTTRYKLAVGTGAAELVRLAAADAADGADGADNESIAQGTPSKVWARWFALCAGAKDGFSCRKLSHPKPAPPSPDQVDGAPAAEDSAAAADPEVQLLVVEITGKPEKTYAAKATLTGHKFYYPGERRGLWRRNRVHPDQLADLIKFAEGLGFQLNHYPEPVQTPGPAHD
jgi:hypothetical protein